MDIVIEVDNVKCRFFNGRTHEINAVDNALSYYKEGYQWTPQYRLKQWDGKVHKFSKAKKTFPTGLLSRVIETLDFLGSKYKVIDTRPKASLNIDEVADRLIEYNIIPRPYQIRGIEKGLQKPNMMFWWPTASGKTVLFGGLIIAYNLPTLVLVNRKDLVQQHMEFLKNNTNLPVGYIMEGEWKPDRITIATTQALWAVRQRSRTSKTFLKNFLSEFGYVIIDEAHHGEAKTFNTPVSECVNATIRHGFSGTPYSLTNDDMELECVTGPVMSRVTMSYLIKKGYLSIPKIRINHYNDRLLLNSSDWHQIYRDGIVDNKVRNDILSELAMHHYNKGRSILITVRQKRHGRDIAQRLRDMKGVSFKDIDYLQGADPQWRRDQVKAKFIKGEVNILIVTAIWNEGVDVPDANVLIKADAGGGGIVEDDRGVRTTLQQVGRVLRKSKTDPDALDVDTTVPQYAYVEDFYDESHQWLLKHSQNRIETFKIEPQFQVEHVGR